MWWYPRRVRGWLLADHSELRVFLEGMLWRVGKGKSFRVVKQNEFIMPREES